MSLNSIMKTQDTVNEAVEDILDYLENADNTNTGISAITNSIFVASMCVPYSILEYDFDFIAVIKVSRKKTEFYLIYNDYELYQYVINYSNKYSILTISKNDRVERRDKDWRSNNRYYKAGHNDEIRQKDVSNMLDKLYRSVHK